MNPWHAIVPASGTIQYVSDVSCILIFILMMQMPLGLPLRWAVDVYRSKFNQA